MKNRHIAYLCVLIGIIHTQTTCMLVRLANKDRSTGLSQTAYLQQRQFRTKVFYPKIRSSQKKFKTLKNRFPNHFPNHFIAQQLLKFERECYEQVSTKPNSRNTIQQTNDLKEDPEVHAKHPVTTSVKL